MSIIQQLTIVSAGTLIVVPNPSNLSNNQIGWFEVLNESSYTLTLQAGGLVVPIPAWCDYPIHVSVGKSVFGGFDLPITITPQLLGSVQPGLSSTLICTYYGIGETPSVTTPQQLTRQVEQVGGIATQIVNTTSPFGAQIIIVQANGAIGAAFVVNNNGLVQVGFGQSGVQMLELGATTPLQLDVPPSLSSGGHPALRANPITGSLDISTNGPTHLVNILGNSTITLDAGNNIITTGQVKFNNGSISRIAPFSGVATNVISTFTHNLGVVPDQIQLTLTGASNALSMVKYDPTTLTSTTVGIIADSSRNFVGIAYKF